MLSIRSRVFAIALTATLSVTSLRAVQAPADYASEIELWRQKREASLLADDGYLTVTGLFWLVDGEHSFGTDPVHDFVLPAGSAPGTVGTIEHNDGETRIRLEPGVVATLNGKPIRESVFVMRPSRPGPPDILAIEDLTLNVHVSGKRYGIRLRDKNSELRKAFTGLRWFPIDPDYRVVADFVPFDEMKTVQLLTLLGDMQDYRAPGYVTFELAGHERRLDPVMRGDQLFFIFRDLTSGKQTYPAARFLYADQAVDGKVVVDFNKAINPACVYSPHTACPYPPKQNRMPIPIEAGALMYKSKLEH